MEAAGRVSKTKSKNNMSSIGLDKKKSKTLADKLNVLLADYMVFYQNTRGLHWNIKGEKFFELHLKFEELYNNLLLKVDEVAERILTLGGVPLHTFEDYSSTAAIKAAKNVSDGRKAVGLILDSFEIILIKQRELLSLSTDADDEGTNSLMSDYIREQEKLVWMYSSYLNK
jgi:starvation-inducible DNA-binding protein